MLSAVLTSFLLAQSVEFTALPVDFKQNWGVYFTASTAVNSRGLDLAQQIKNKGSSIIVVDMQYGGGRLAYPSKIPLSVKLGNTGNLIKDPYKLVADFHNQGYYVIVRYVLFKQWHLTHAKPEWSLKNKWNDKPFTSQGGLTWLDPGNPELKRYLTDVILEITDFGFDEIQFDYVRFPEAGRGGKIYYTFTGDPQKTRDQVITDFVKEISEILHFISVPVSLDLFGIVVWNDLDWRLIGQNVPELAKHVDYLSPMPYPSHYSPGFLGCRNPAVCEYKIVKETMEKFLMQTYETGVRMRPWVQGFAMKVPRFGPRYIESQVKALRDIGIDQFLIWNASNNYWAVFKANLLQGGS